jgi:hypothetical protein
MYKLYLHLSFSGAVWDTQLVLLNATRQWFYSFCATPNNLGVPVSSWGNLEYNRVGLTVYIASCKEGNKVLFGGMFFILYVIILKHSISVIYMSTVNKSHISPI